MKSFHPAQALFNSAWENAKTGFYFGGSMEVINQTQREENFEIPGLNLHGYLSFAKNPYDTQAILDVQKTLLGHPNRAEMVQWVIKSIESSPEFMARFQERYIPRFPTMQELEACPEGSLGKEIWTHLKKNNISLDFAGLDTSMFYQAEMTPIAYLGIRGIRLHDIIHVVLGLGTTPLEEYAHVAYTSAQYMSPFHLLLLSTGYINTALYNAGDIPKFLDIVHKYHELGKTSKFITAYKFEDNLQKPLSEVRAELDLPRDLGLN
jgi:ubiquinone biosynthesis protein COQ4